MKKFLPWGIIVLFLLLGLWGWHFNQEIQSLKKHLIHSRKSYSKLECAMQQTKLGTLPPDLQNIPFADKSGIVLDVKKVPIRNVPAPYNASLIENGSGGYLIVFRYDVIHPDCSDLPYPFYAYLGCAKLNSKFEQTDEEFKTLNTHNKFSEDPRFVKVGNSLFVIYNALAPNTQSCRTMNLLNLNVHDLSTNYVTELDIGYQPIEKNWPPFEYVDENNQSSLYFEYQLNPHKILKLDDPRINQFTDLKYPISVTFRKVGWPHVWGPLRGGTPARKIGNEYLSFFHSSFHDKDGFVWYIMGAFTFEAKPPFRITAVSYYPILFDGIYDSPIMHTANPRVRAIFPAGFVIENRNGQELIHLSCGENDTTIKIITFDKNALLKSLKKI